MEMITIVIIGLSLVVPIAAYRLLILEREKAVEEELAATRLAIRLRMEAKIRNYHHLESGTKGPLTYSQVLQMLDRALEESK